MNETSLTLYAAAQDAITLPEALDHAAPRGGIALLATPKQYHLAQVDASGRLRTRSATVQLDEVFDARVFDERVELRWLHIADGRGRAVLLTEDPDALPSAFDDQITPVEAVDSLPGAYLLWGGSAARGQDWSTLTTERIGTLHVPAQIPEGRHAQLVTREYLAIEPIHGNAYIAEERLIRIEPARVSEPAEDDTR